MNAPILEPPTSDVTPELETIVLMYGLTPEDHREVLLRLRELRIRELRWIEDRLGMPHTVPKKRDKT